MGYVTSSSLNLMFSFIWPNLGSLPKFSYVCYVSNARKVSQPHLSYWNYARAISKSFWAQLIKVILPILPKSLIAFWGHFRSVHSCIQIFHFPDFSVYICHKKVTVVDPLPPFLVQRDIAQIWNQKMYHLKCLRSLKCLQF